MISKLLGLIKEIILQLRFIFHRSVSIGRHVRIARSAKIDSQGGKIAIQSKSEILHGVLLLGYGGKIFIGEKCSINPYTIIYGHGNGTIIGNNVLIAGHCMIIPNNHVFDDKTKPINTQGGVSKGIIIEDDVWLGHGCSVLDGIKIGKGSIIGSGSVVNKDIPPFSIAAGVPVKIISTRL